MKLSSTERELQALLDSSYGGGGPLRTLWKLFKPRRFQLFLVGLLFAIKQSPVWVLPIVTGNIITHITQIYAAHQSHLPPADPQAVRWIVFDALLMFVLIAQNVPTHTLYASLLSNAVRHVQLVVRSALVVRFQQLSMGFHDSIQAGRLQSKVLRDGDAIEGLARTLVENLFQGVIFLGVALIVTLTKRPSVALFFLITVPLAALLTQFFHKMMRQRNEVFRREVEAMSGSVSEMIAMIPITRAHAVEQTEVDRLSRQLERISTSGEQLDRGNNLFGSCSWATFQTFQLLCLMFNIWQCDRGEISVGDVVMYQGFFVMLVNAVQGVINMMPQLTSGVESMRSIGEVLESPDIEQNEGKRSIESVRGEIEFDHVTFRYPSASQAALDDVSLSVHAGECIALVGESGSGKSTLMNLLIGFRRPTAGRVLLDGVDMATINYRSFRRFLAVVPQQTLLFSGSVRDNITYGLEHVTSAQLDAVLHMANCADFIARLPQGLDTWIGNQGGNLSGGQRQRIAIARALLRDPRFIILDEATSALDLHSEHLVQQAIERLIAGRTTFIVAHRLSTIRGAHRVAVMSEGRIIEIGSRSALLSQSESAFSRLHALQV